MYKHVTSYTYLVFHCEPYFKYDELQIMDFFRKFEFVT